MIIVRIKLLLSTQVAAKWNYISDRPYHTFKINELLKNILLGKRKNLLLEGKQTTMWIYNVIKEISGNIRKKER